MPYVRHDLSISIIANPAHSLPTRYGKTIILRVLRTQVCKNPFEKFNFFKDHTFVLDQQPNGT